MTEIRVPLDLWEDDREGVVVSWLYRDGALVEAGKVVTEVAVEKAQMEIVAGARGRLKILCPAESIIVRGQVIGTIE
jgi:pyruvate/2-oxoglutarate dehydrogenase complex dihydrolipoamide acyltransferase (E2) component